MTLSDCLGSVPLRDHRLAAASYYVVAGNFDVVTDNEIPAILPALIDFGVHITIILSECKSVEPASRSFPPLLS